MRDRDVKVKLLVELITTNTFKVIMALIKKLFFKELAGIIQRSRIAWAHLLEEFDQSSFSDGVIAEVPVWFLLNRGGNEHALGIVIHILEQGEDFLVCTMLDGRIFDSVADSGESTQKYRDRHGAFAVEFEDNVVGLTGFELHPSSTVRNQFGHGEQASRSAIRRSFKVNAGRTDQLRNNDTFRSVNNVSSLISHFREIAQEDILLDRFGNIRSSEENRNIKRTGICQIALYAFFNGVLRITKPILQPPLLRFGAAAWEE